MRGSSCARRETKIFSTALLGASDYRPGRVQLLVLCSHLSLSLSRLPIAASCCLLHISFRCFSFCWDSARFGSTLARTEGGRGREDRKTSNFFLTAACKKIICACFSMRAESVLSRIISIPSLSPLLSACLPFYVPSFDKLGGVCVVSAGQIQFVYCYLVGKRKLALFSFLSHLPNFIVPPSSGERKYLHLIPRHVDPTRRYLVFRGFFYIFPALLFNHLSFHALV